MKSKKFYKEDIVYNASHLKHADNSIVPISMSFIVINDFYSSDYKLLQRPFLNKIKAFFHS
jgi:hypothetical protein